jgi:hypothetical protein
MDLLTRSPSDILRYIVSFLVYTPDTARLSRVNQTLARTPRLYPASAHCQPHGEVSIYRTLLSPLMMEPMQDGRTMGVVFGHTFNDRIFKLQKVGSCLLKTEWNPTTKRMLNQAFMSSDRSTIYWSLDIDKNGPYHYRYFRNGEKRGYCLLRRDTDVIQLDIYSDHSIHITERWTFVNRRAVSHCRVAHSTESEFIGYRHWPDGRITYENHNEGTVSVEIEEMLICLFDYDMGMF